jgi:hypothetical protein
MPCVPDSSSLSAGVANLIGQPVSAERFARKKQHRRLRLDTGWPIWFL